MAIEEQYGLLSPSKSPSAENPPTVMDSRSPDSHLIYSMAMNYDLQPSPEQPGRTDSSAEPAVCGRIVTPPDTANHHQETSTVVGTARAQNEPSSSYRGRFQDVRLRRATSDAHYSLDLKNSCEENSHGAVIEYGSPLLSTTAFGSNSYYHAHHDIGHDGQRQDMGVPT